MSRTPRVIVVANVTPALVPKAIALHLASLGAPVDTRVHLRTIEPAAHDVLAGHFGKPEHAATVVRSADLPETVLRGFPTFGIHLGGAARATLRAVRGELGRDAWISVPAHTDEDVTRAREDGASAVYVSPVFETPGKGPARGLGAIRAARALAGPMLVYALGGIGWRNAAECIDAGADGVAAIRSVFEDAVSNEQLLRLQLAVRDALRDRTDPRP